MAAPENFSRVLDRTTDVNQPSFTDRLDSFWSENGSDGMESWRAMNSQRNTSDLSGVLPDLHIEDTDSKPSDRANAADDSPVKERPTELGNRPERPQQSCFNPAGLPVDEPGPAGSLARLLRIHAALCELRNSQGGGTSQ